MLSDRELLELAAKAAGIGPFNPRHATDHTGLPYWNPLTDDGDALRLAVKLGLTVDVRPIAVCIFKGNKQYLTFGAVEGEDDLFGATRRAITRAAAEIQLTKERQNV